MRLGNIFFLFAIVVALLNFSAPASAIAQEVEYFTAEELGISDTRDKAVDIASANAWASINEQLAEAGYLCCEEIEIFVLVQEVSFEYSHYTRNSMKERFHWECEIKWKLEVFVIVP